MLLCSIPVSITSEGAWNSGWFLGLFCCFHILTAVNRGGNQRSPCTEREVFSIDPLACWFTLLHLGHGTKRVMFFSQRFKVFAGQTVERGEGLSTGDYYRCAPSTQPPHRGGAYHRAAKALLQIDRDRPQFFGRRCREPIPPKANRGMTEGLECSDKRGHRAKIISFLSPLSGLPSNARLCLFTFPRQFSSSCRAPPSL